MIDFRYHLVSIVAVFLALAIGIVIGASALKPETLKVLDRASRQEKQQISGLQAEKKNMQAQITSDQAFAEAAAPQMLANLLSGQKVVIVTTPGADGPTVTGISTALHQAGAKVTGQVQMQQAFFDTSASTQNAIRRGPWPRWSVPGRLDTCRGACMTVMSRVLSGAGESAAASRPAG